MNNDALTTEVTEDGSLTLFSPVAGEHYHSTHGAMTESLHIFLNLGFCHFVTSRQVREVCVLEAGLGTGLNALLTMQEAVRRGIRTTYYTYELYPLTDTVCHQLHFDMPDCPEADEWLRQIHTAEWNCSVSLHPLFTLIKMHADLTTATLPHNIQVVYWDAFSPEAQPELWSEDLLARVSRHCSAGAVLTTYCAKGEVRRRLARCGFAVERMAGPPGGKREVLRGTCSNSPHCVPQGKP